MIGITKGLRFARIIGNYGEHLVLKQLARSGFEVIHADQVGLDVIAYHPSTKVRLGITVKSLMRVFGTETHSVNIFKQNNNDREKLRYACEVFGCVPWIAAYVECDDRADLYLTSLVNYDLKYRKNERAVDTWGMIERQKADYALDPEIKHIRYDFKATHWWTEAEGNLATIVAETLPEK